MYFTHDPPLVLVSVYTASPDGRSRVFTFDFPSFDLHKWYLPSIAFELTAIHSAYRSSSAALRWACSSVSHPVPGRPISEPQSHKLVPESRHRRSSSPEETPLLLET